MSETHPTPGIHTGPVPPLVGIDPTLILSDHPEVSPGDGCRDCGASHSHRVGCSVQAPGREVRVGDTLPLPSDMEDVALGPMIDGPSGLRVKRERDFILERAGNLISDVRDQEYGSALDNFTAVGRLWAVTFGLDEPISPELVAIALCQLKQARLLTHPNHRDSWDDGTGYMALGGDIAAELEADRRTAQQR